MKKFCFTLGTQKLNLSLIHIIVQQRHSKRKIYYEKNVLNVTICYH